METLELLNLDLSNIEKIQNEQTEQDISLSKSLRDVDKFEKKYGKGFDSLLARGAVYYNAKDYQKCEHYFEKAAKVKYDINIISALMKLYSKTNRIQKILPHLENSRETLGNHFSFWQFAGFAYAELEMPDETADNLLKARELGSEGELTINLLLKSLGKQKRYEEQFKVSNEEIDKENLTKVTVESFVSSCIKLRKFKDILDFLDNTSFDWQSNAILLAFAGIAHQSFNDNFEETLRLNKKALEVDPDNVEIRWNLALTQLRHGELREGIENYKVRFDWTEFPSPRRKFDVPKWHEGVNKYSRILIWSEQGIADEILFSTALNAFTAEFPNLIFETHFKLPEVMARSFSDIHCRPGLFNEETLKPVFDDYQFHVPLGDIFLWFISKNIEKIEAGETLSGLDYLQVDELRRKYWEFKLNKENKKPKIGFCWSSSVLTDGRDAHHTQLEDWKSLLSRDDVDFVSLQYDVDYEDIEKEYSEYSKYFLDTGYLDQMDDIDGALALISNLDLVITSPSAPYSLAGALGVETWYYSAASHFMLGRNGKFLEHPLLPNMKNYVTRSAQQDNQIMKDFDKKLNKFVSKFQIRKS